jgi:hypothetical protein
MKGKTDLVHPNLKYILEFGLRTVDLLWDMILCMFRFMMIFAMFYKYKALGWGHSDNKGLQWCFNLCARNVSCGALPFKENSGFNSKLIIFLIEIPSFVQVTYLDFFDGRHNFSHTRFYLITYPLFNVVFLYLFIFVSIKWWVHCQSFLIFLKKGTTWLKISITNFSRTLGTQQNKNIVMLLFGSHLYFI